ncbi:MAG: phenylalanine--tRNA ligase subunit beta [Bacteroidales bacterium]
MNISLSWLKDYVSFDMPAEKVAEVLTFIGLEVEDMQIVEEIPGGLRGVVVAEVLECINHPNSDHLHITKVDIGKGEPLQIICGAPNVAAGQKVLLATIGTELRTSDGEIFKIKKGKMRGEVSLGMICAEDELGIGADHEGIMVLDPSAVVGTSAKEYLNLKSDVIYGIGLTPNRVDGASHIGVARDFAAYLKYNKIGGDLNFPDVSSFKEGDGKGIEISVEDTDAAPRYTGLTMEVENKESPEWMKKKLLAIGINPKNIIVDVTNFILNETGQPLHSFDADKIKGDKIVVRKAKKGEKLVTLDGIERELSTEDLMICNSEEPMCLAGVFGGLDSGISENTSRVFLESAYFNPVTIRKSSKRHTLKTDASFRYERGADPHINEYALKRAALLLLQYASGKVVGKIQEIYPKKIERKEVDLNLNKMEALMGKKIGHQTIIDILKYLDFEILSSDQDLNLARVSVPTYRVDVYRECDVVEEVLRIYGYNNIELPENISSSVNFSSKPDLHVVNVKACDFLAAKGFMEIMSNSLTKGSYYDELKTFPAENCVKIINPLSQDLNVMRQTLLFCALEAAAYNFNRQVTNIKFFEMGNVYSYNPEKGLRSELPSYHEESHLSMLMTGKDIKFWHNLDEGGSYFALKGYLEVLLRRFGLDLYSFDTELAPSDIYSEGLVYKVNSKKLVSMGTVSHARLKQCDIKQAVYYAEINWTLLQKLYKKEQVIFQELPKFPIVKRDLALVVDESVSFASIRKAAYQAENKLLKEIILFDVYRGDKIEKGKKQYAISFLLQDPDKTLTDKYVDKIMRKFMGSFEHQFSATLR